MDSALSVSLSVTDHLDVSLVSPTGSPRVSDEVVVVRSLSSVSDGNDSVVELGGAASLEDSTFVELEPHRSSVDGNTDWLLTDGSNKSLFTSDLNVSVSSESVSGLNVLLTGSITSRVRVSLLGGDSVVDDVLESIVHKTSVTSFVLVLSSSTVNQLLFGEVGEGSILKEKTSFDGSDS